MPDTSDRSVIDQENYLIDPDPITIIGLVIGAASLILQIAPMARNYVGERQSAPSHLNYDTVRHLETAIEEFRASVDRTERLIQRSADRPEAEFYEARHGISESIMNLPSSGVAAYHGGISDAAVKMSTMATWVGSILAHNPGFAAYIGDQVGQQLHNSAERLNELVRSASSNGAILAEAKHVLAVAQNILATILNQQVRKN